MEHYSNKIMAYTVLFFPPGYKDIPTESRVYGERKVESTNAQDAITKFFTEVSVYQWTRQDILVLAAYPKEIVK